MNYKNKLSNLAQQAGTKTALLLLGGVLLTTSCTCTDNDKKYTQKDLDKEVAKKLTEEADKNREAKEKSAYRGAMATIGGWSGMNADNFLVAINKAHSLKSETNFQTNLLRECVYKEGDEKKGVVDTITGAFRRAVEAAAKNIKGGATSGGAASKNSDFIYFVFRSLKLIPALDATFTPGKYSEEAVKKLREAYENDMKKIKVVYKVVSDATKPLETTDQETDPDADVQEGTKIMLNELDDAHKTYRATLGMSPIDKQDNK